MRRQSVVRMGPGAASLILIFVMLSMSVLGMLTLMTARNDLRLGERSAEVAEKIYELNAKAEMTLAAMMKDPASYMDMEKRISWDEEGEGYTLRCQVEVVEKDDGAVQFRWTRHALEAAIAGGEDEWNF